VNREVVTKPSSSSCARVATTAAYLDGELDSAAAALFEEHLRACTECADALAEQRRLLRLLDTAFDPFAGEDVALPRDFTRVVTARAQTDMSGLRQTGERRLALRICAALAALLVLLCATVFEGALAPLKSLFGALVSVAGMLWRGLTEAGAGAAVIIRALGGYFIQEPGLWVFCQWMFLAGALVVLWYAIGSYHRAQRQ
jgi:anti-sigma factor RsiW